MKKAKDIPIGGLFADQVGNRTKRFAIPLLKGEAAELSKALAKVGKKGGALVVCLHQISVLVAD